MVDKQVIRRAVQVRKMARPVGRAQYGALALAFGATPLTLQAQAASVA